jgi:hypothetical protein
MNRFVSTAVALGVTLVGGAAFAQDPAPTRVRGSIDSVSGQTLNITGREGEKLSVTLRPGAMVTEVSQTKITDIKPGSYVGTTAAPQADGELKALEVHIFPENMRGAGEGHRPWDLGPKSTMTNGTVGNVVGTHDRTITVEYGGKQKKVLVPADVPVVTFEPGDAGELKAGAHVVIFATKAADGTLSADRVNVGKDGLTPPM